VRALLSAVGVAFSVAILVIGLFMFDGVDRLMDLQFGQIQREDISITFNEPLSPSVRYALARENGVTRVETFRMAPARLRAGHLEREVSLQGMAPDGRLRRIMSSDGLVHPLPAEGVVLSKVLADRLRVAPGDIVSAEILEGTRRRGSIPVTGVVDDFLGASAYMTPDALQRLTGGEAVVSGAYLAVDRDRRAPLLRRLKGMPAVAGVGSPAEMLASFQAQLGDSLFIAIGFLLGFASVISIGVIYNGARIALSERGRELASLRVMGFHRSEVAAFLLGEQAAVTALAIPLGWCLGWLMALAISGSLQSDVYRIPLVVSVRTYAIAAVVTIIAAIASGWIVRRRINQLDLIAVLKTRE
jgi:putative ABC transport system permease protein